MHENATSHKVQLKLRRIELCRIRYLEGVIMSLMLQPHQYDSRSQGDGFRSPAWHRRTAYSGESFVEIATVPTTFLLAIRVRE